MKPFYYLSDFPERKSQGRNYLTECPKCGKKHLSISKETGFFHCFYGGCGFNGRLREFWEESNPKSSYSTHNSTPASTGRISLSDSVGKVKHADSEVPMIPNDFKSLAEEVMAKIKPLTNDPDTQDADQLAARRYLADQGISIETAMAARMGCLSHRCFGKEDDKQKSGGMVYHCIAYVNYVNGRAVNVKYRSVDPSAQSPRKTSSTSTLVSGENPVQTATPGETSIPPAAAPNEVPVSPSPHTLYSKCWSQDSPTKPCAPYGIDCINPLLVIEDTVERLIVTEGEKDCIVLREAGYPYVISMPNGAEARPAEVFEAFEPWLEQVKDVVVCGDTDRPGRTLTARLTHYFGARALFAVLPNDCKDIGEVMAAYGRKVVCDVIDKALPVSTGDIIRVEQQAHQVMEVLHGHFDHGYSVGHGPLTDRLFHPTDQGGLMIVTGMPNCGKTDFLNDLMCRIMVTTDRFVCFCSFEVPDKNKHIARMMQLKLGRLDTSRYTDEQLRPSIEFLNNHMAHLDLQEVQPTPENILRRADLIRRTHRMHYLVVDPYLFVQVETGKGTTETQAIKQMLTTMQNWGRRHGVWVVVVAHPRSLQKLSGRNELEAIDMYTISGSANWANLADFIFTLRRINEPDRRYTRLDMLKVRDQDLCQTGTVLYVRQSCGRYSERESEEQILSESEEE